MGGLFKNKVSSKSGKYAAELHFRSILGVILEPRGAHKLKKTCFFDVCVFLIFSSIWGGPGDPKKEGRRQRRWPLRRSYQAHP